jgi:glycogen synthase
MNVQFASGEACTFFTSGTPGDMTGSMEAALQQRQKVRARVILPLYHEMMAEWRALVRRAMVCGFGWAEPSKNTWPSTGRR